MADEKTIVGLFWERHRTEDGDVWCQLLLRAVDPAIRKLVDNKVMLIIPEVIADAGGGTKLLDQLATVLAAGLKMDVITMSVPNKG